MNAPSLPQILDLAENVNSVLLRKKFYKIGPGLNVIKRFASVIYKGS